MKGGCRNSKDVDSANLEKHVVRATLDEVARLTALLKTLMPGRLSEEEGDAVELGVAEVLTNIVVHGYPDKEPGSITVCWEERASRLRIDVLDDGLPIPEDFLTKRSAEAFDFYPADVENLPVSGFGLGLIYAIFDVVTYRRTGNVNCMSLEKEFSN